MDDIDQEIMEKGGDNEIELNIMQVPAKLQEAEVQHLIKKLKFNLGLEVNPYWSDDDIKS